MVDEHAGPFPEEVAPLAWIRDNNENSGWPRAQLQRQLTGHHSRNGNLLIGDRLADVHDQWIDAAEVEHSEVSFAGVRESLFKVHIQRVQSMATVGLEKTGR